MHHNTYDCTQRIIQRHSVSNVVNVTTKHSPNWLLDYIRQFTWHIIIFNVIWQKLTYLQTELFQNCNFHRNSESNKKSAPVWILVCHWASPRVLIQKWISGERWWISQWQYAKPGKDFIIQEYSRVLLLDWDKFFTVSNYITVSVYEVSISIHSR